MERRKQGVRRREPPWGYGGKRAALGRLEELTVWQAIAEQPNVEDWQMKVCVFLLVIVVAPVWADDIIWERGQPKLLVPQKGIPHAIGQNTNSQNASHGAQETVSLIEPQPSTNTLQSTKEANGEREKEELLVHRTANDIQRDLVVVTIFVGLIQSAILGIQVWLAWFATRHARDAVQIAREEMKIANRAYLFVSNWKVVDLRADANAIVMGTIDNAGHTPAIIEKRAQRCRVYKEKPPPLTPAHLNSKSEDGTPVNARGRVGMTFDPLHIGSGTYQELEGKAKFLYTSVCFVYRDVFDQQYWVVSTGRYDIESRTFNIVEGRGYNSFGVYREEEWKNKAAK